MNGTHVGAMFLTAWLAMGACVQGDDNPAAGKDLPVAMRIGGVGGVYFLAEPGELVVDVEKCDRNRHAMTTQLRAILAGPDRRVLQEAVIPGDGLPPGKMGPPQRVRLSTRVERKGVFVLNITVSQDRYGDEMVWGIRTNCPHYVIETSRGHRDERHQEPIVLADPSRPGNVCFLPHADKIDMEVSGLPRSVHTLTMYDGRDAIVETLPVGTDGRVAHTFPARTHRDAVPWRLSLPVQQATVQIDGLTRWDRRDACLDMSYWTPEAKAFFPFQ